MDSNLPAPKLTGASIELIETRTDRETRRTVPVEPTIALQAFTVPGATARYAYLTERQLLDLIGSGIKVLQKIHKNGA